MYTKIHTPTAEQFNYKSTNILLDGYINAILRYSFMNTSVSNYVFIMHHIWPHAGSMRINLLRCMARCRTRQLNQALSVLFL